MDTVFAGNIEVLVVRNGREVTRVVRPLRRTPTGPVVRYKRKLWLVQNNTINISAGPLVEEEDTDEIDDAPAIAEVSILASVALNSEPESANTLIEPSPVTDFVSKDDGQDAVISADSEERLLVDAGPGTGKTHTACLKVASLIRDYDIPPSRIWIISFTRTAVHEIRNRLASLLEDAGDAASVRIATLDSMAWTIHSGFSRDAVLTGSYDDNIAETLAKIRTNPDVRDEFGKLHHVIIDEAQDIVGVRAELVLAIVDALNDDCGVTVFSDQAQAIYGFSEDESDEKSNVKLLEELEDRDFRCVSLDEVHRTDSPALLKIFTDVRRKVLNEDVPAAARGAEIRTEIERLADASVGAVRNLKLSELPSNSLVLMRQRSDVLLASSFNRNTPHRLRMSGLPVRILPWPALLLWDHVERRLTRDAFDRLWEDRIAGRAGVPTPEAAWQLMFEAAGESASVIDLHRLRTVLGRSNPPAPFTSPEYGDRGPILGTIHASKGREAEEVCLYLPPAPDGKSDEDDANEEVRVMFVGATRARKKLSVGSTSGRRFGNIEGRFWKKYRRNQLQVEIGRMYDMNASGLVGQPIFPNMTDALNAQNFLAQNPMLQGLFAEANRALGWNFTLVTKDGLRLGALSEKVKSDLWDLARRFQRRSLGYLPHIRSVGLRSMVLRTDDPALDQLHEPWRSSGFLLAPMLLGICMTRFR